MAPSTDDETDDRDHQAPADTDTPPYTFGDNDTAADRLRWLAAAFRPSSQLFLRRLAREPARVAVDLGCGPGYTTALLAAAIAPRATIGLDASARYVAAARRQAARDLTFHRHDVTTVPFPTPPADLLYGRHILAHLRETAAVIDRWADACTARGRLAMEEVASIESEDPDFQKYYALVAAMQAHYGQNTFVGGQLAALAPGPRWQVAEVELTPVSLAAPIAARLHALNLRTWRDDPFVRAHAAPSELGRLLTVLDAVAAGSRAAPAVRWTLAQVVLRRAAV